MTDALLEAFSQLFTPQGLLALVVGVAIGIVTGIVPGSSLTGLLTVLGVAYAFDPAVAIPLAVGSLVPVATMDAIPATLMGVPGNAGGAALILESYPLSKRGRATEALAATYGSSLVGGLLGVGILIAFVPFARDILGLLGSPEYLAVALLGVVILGLISRGAVAKGLLSGVAGLLLGMVGLDIAYNAERLTFGSDYLFNGIPTIPFVLGLFALPEMAMLMAVNKPISGLTTRMSRRQEVAQTLAGLRAVVRHWFTLLRSIVTGVIVGIMPGVGGTVIDWIVYAQARQSAKGKPDDEFGRGDMRGVVAVGGADNALVAAAFIPTIALGIPGSVSMAIFIGFLILIGVQPGPEMLSTHLDLTYLIIICIALGNVLSAGSGILFGRFFAKLTFVPAKILAPCVAGFLIVLSFQGQGTLGDLVLLLLAGVLGLAMKIYGWARPPLLIGFVLAPVIERYGRLTINAYGWEVLWRPQVIVILSLVVAFVVYTRVRARLVRTVALEVTAAGAAQSEEAERATR